VTRHRPEHMIHMVCGATGAGKSTYALDLCGDIGGVHLSIDEWMVTLFWDDSPDPIESEWTMERINRCELQMWAMTQQLTQYNIPAVLDLGFSTRDHRMKFARLATESGLSAQLHFVDLPREDRWERVKNRNAKREDALGKGKNLNKAFMLEVDKEMFNFVEDMWEPPDDDEMTALNGVRITE